MQGILIALRTSGQVWTGRFRTRLARTTARERVLLIGLAAGAMIYVPIAASGWRAEQETRYSETMLERSSARLAAASARRIERTSQDEAALRDMQSWGFEGNNLDVIRVRIEQRLIEAATAAGLENLQVQIAEEAEASGPTTWLRADVEAGLKWGPTFSFLDRLSGWSEGFRVMSFEYEGYTPPAAEPVASEGQPRRRAVAANAAKLRMALAFPLVNPPEPPVS